MSARTESSVPMYFMMYFVPERLPLRAAASSSIFKAAALEVMVWVSGVGRPMLFVYSIKECFSWSFLVVATSNWIALHLVVCSITSFASPSSMADATPEQDTQISTLSLRMISKILWMYLALPSAPGLSRRWKALRALEVRPQETGSNRGSKSAPITLCPAAKKVLASARPLVMPTPVTRMVLVSRIEVCGERMLRRCFSAHDLLNRPSTMLRPRTKVSSGRKARLRATRTAFWAA